MPRAKIHADHNAGLRANAAARQAAGLVRKSVELTPVEQASLDALRSAWSLDNDRAVMRRLIADAAKKLAKARSKNETPGSS